MDNILPYLHYYIGQKAKDGDNISTIDGCFQNIVHLTCPLGKTSLVPSYLVKPIVRMLSSMTEEEAVEICKLDTEPKRWASIDVLEINKDGIHYIDGSKWYADGVEELNDCHVSFNHISSDIFHELIKMGFWLWDESAFEKGLIIDAETVK
jgi:hypothetical protein